MNYFIFLRLLEQLPPTGLNSIAHARLIPAVSVQLHE